MSFSTPIHVGRRTGAWALGVGLALVLFTGTPAVLPANADSAVAPKSASFTVRGAGFGHGWGMSQYGAYGAAVRGLSWRQILGFYYPGTTLGTLPKRSTIRVWITSDDDNSLRVSPNAGLTLRDGSGRSYRLPTGTAYRAWQVSRAGDGYRLQSRSASGTWTTRRAPLGTSTWSFASSSKIIKVVMPSGSVREYRGTVALVKRGSGARTVNKVSMESYVRGVVPAEMPTSWHPNAVRAQAVAARSFAARTKANARTTGYDVCDTVNCQVYRGYAYTYRGQRVVRETRGGNAAAAATARTVVKYRGTIAFTQFASSNGGHSANNGYPYLRAKRDPYDGVITSQAWTRTISAASVSRIWGVGTVRSIRIVRRGGAGRYGGRVQALRITGSKRTVTVSGTSFQYTYGMRSNLFTLAR